MVGWHCIIGWFKFTLASWHAPDESADGVLGDLFPILDQGISGLLDRLWQVHRYITSYRRSMKGPISCISVFIIQKLPTHPGHMRLGIVLHEEEPPCISIRSDVRSEDSIGYDMEVCMTFQGYAFSHHH